MFLSLKQFWRERRRPNWRSANSALCRVMVGVSKGRNLRAHSAARLISAGKRRAAALTAKRRLYATSRHRGRRLPKEDLFPFLRYKAVASRARLGRRLAPSPGVLESFRTIAPGSGSHRDSVVAVSKARSTTISAIVKAPPARKSALASRRSRTAYSLVVSFTYLSMA
jgi:hypothetical protein